MLTEIEKKITKSVEDLSKSVVIVRVNKPPMRLPFGGIAPQRGEGSGFILDSIGNIVTNYHVIIGAENVDVVLSDGRTFSGKVVGGDKATDVALIKIDGTNLPVAKLGDSEKLKVGQFALAVGNALGMEGAPTVSTGVVSAYGRPLPGADLIFEGLIQTDAAINPGNSGGPLADLDGNVIGMNTAVIQFAQGVGFAIPINHIKWVIEQVLEKGRVVRPVLGVLITNISPPITERFKLGVRDGALITNIAKDSPAQKAGLKEMDVIQKIGIYDVKSSKDLVIALSRLQINKETTVRVSRAGKQIDIKLKLMESPG